MEQKEFTVREINIALDPSWTPTNLQVIFKKIDETRFRVCGIRYRFGGDPVQKLYGIFDYDINISGAPIDRTDNILKQYYPGGIEEVKETFGSEANYVIADSWIPYIVPLDPYEIEEEYTSEDEALRAMQEYIKSELKQGYRNPTGFRRWAKVATNQKLLYTHGIGTWKSKKTATNTYYNITLFLSANIERNYWFRGRYQMI